MKKNMLFAILIATFFSCTELLDEISITETGKDIITDSLENVIGKNDSTLVEDTTTIVEDSDSISNDVNPDIKRLGLFSTNQELEIWRYRMKNGPFRVKNDVGSNSPGDYGRILKNANLFINNTSADRVTWPNEPLKHGSFEPRESHLYLRDAAFVYLLTGDTKYAEAVKKELLAQSAEPSCNFANKTIFSKVRTGNPYFDIAAWMSRLLYSYDLVEDVFSASEKEQMKNWFLKGANLYQKGVDENFLTLWPKRNAGDYTPSSKAKQFSTYTHDGGYKVYIVNRWYNNRAAAEVMFFGLVGVKFNNSTLINSAKRWFKEWLTYGIYPSGLCVEFHRTYDDNSRPEAGYGYSSITADYMTNLADALARSGDRELYDYNTSGGYGESKGGQKNLLLVLQTLSKLLYDEYYDEKTERNAIYYSSSHTEATKMDGRKGSDVWARPIWFAHANAYYNDPVIRSTYTRIINENMTYNNVAGLDPFCGAMSILPAKLFLWGNLEGEINPFIDNY